MEGRANEDNEKWGETSEGIHGSGRDTRRETLERNLGQIKRVSNNRRVECPNDLIIRWHAMVYPENILISRRGGKRGYR